MSTLEDKLRDLHDDMLQHWDRDGSPLCEYGCDEMYALEAAAALGAAEAYERAAKVADDVTVTVTDFRRLGMGVYAERIRALATKAGGEGER